MVKQVSLFLGLPVLALAVAYDVGVATHQLWQTGPGPAFLIFVGVYLLTFELLRRRFDP